MIIEIFLSKILCKNRVLAFHAWYFVLFFSVYVTKRQENTIFPFKIALMPLMPDISGLIKNKRDIKKFYCAFFEMFI